MASAPSTDAAVVVVGDGEASEYPEVVGEHPLEELATTKGLDEVQVVETQQQTSDVGPHGEACSHCTREYSVASMVNFGCKSYPKYRCKACHTASRALERSAKSKGEGHCAKFCEARRQRPKHFNDLLLQIRISPEGEEPLPTELEKLGATGLCPNLAERKERITKMVATYYSDKGLEDYEDMRWMCERQFRAYMKTKQDMSAAEAQAEWDKAMIATDTERRVKHGVTQVAVLAAEGRRHYRRKGSRKERLQEEEVSSEDSDVERTKKRLRGHMETEEGMELCLGDLGVVKKAVTPPPLAKATHGAKSVAALLDNLAGKCSQGSKCGSDAGVAGEDDEGEVFELLDATELEAMGLTKACVGRTFTSFFALMRIDQFNNAGRYSPESQQYRTCHAQLLPSLSF